MTTFAAAIFDMDGLLVDSEPVWRKVEIAVFARHGVTLTDELCLQTKGMFLPDVARYWYARTPWEGTGPDAVAAEVLEAMAARLAEGAELKDGARHAVDFCRDRGMRLAVASSSPRGLIDAALGHVELADRFEVVHSAEDEVMGKPDPAIFRTTAELLEVTPAQCVVFEDAPAGVQAAKAAGMVCVAVPEPHPESVGNQAPAEGAEGKVPEGMEAADVVLGSLAELDDTVLDRLASLVDDPDQTARARRRISATYSGK
jgi:sugar-phosphatase